MKATVLADNIGSENLPGEWGLSIYIEAAELNILLDCGASSLYRQNAESLGLEIAAVDLAVLSHAHYDHADGMADFFQHNQKAPPPKIVIKSRRASTNISVCRPIF